MEAAREGGGEEAAEAPAEFEWLDFGSIDDANNDGVVSHAEKAAAAAPLSAALDTNRDGVISAAE